MFDLADFLWSFSLISLLLHLLQLLRTAISMARSSNSPSPSAYPLKRVRFRSVFSPKSIAVASMNHLQESLSQEGPDFTSGERPQQPNSCSKARLQEHAIPLATKEQYPQEINSRLQGNPEEHLFENSLVFARREEEPEVSRKEGLSSFARNMEVETKKPSKVRRRPARIVIPETDHQVLGFDEVGSDLGEKEYQVQGRDFCLASKKGRKKVMEDGYSVITDISGDSRQAFFGVFDGHGGRAAVDYVTEKLGNNILRAIEKTEKVEDPVEKAIRASYLITDKEFLSQGKSSGACASTVLLKDAELHVANVGDCRVVLSRNGTAIALTNDHHVGREDERLRIESSGGYVDCHKGVWRVQGSLAVSRAIGDSHLKEWILSEPETNKIQLASDCEFLIVASDGLWDKVTNQEAVDVVMRHKNAMESCKVLVDISSCRGNKDDITVMVVDLKNFRQICGEK